MSTVTRSRKPLQAVQVEVRWVRRLFANEIDPQSGCLEIGGQFYGVVAIDGGFRLTKPDGTVYDIDTNTSWGGWSCDCPDGTYRGHRPGGCRHVAGLRAALAAPRVA